ncbi:hypothetical protein H7F15_08655 [Pontibacter sp. Tf4]|uniref:hypothetical protein n=1 Tax=Pontibacter sp. Tf4 TaxID=2761620 RepID=UPI00162AEAB2|nr:hypothetical protein [Pontibacter sp. Tf4]MBB6611103.1 hypothetical protein [Pontibacter sp. Tf4]
MTRLAAIFAFFLFSAFSCSKEEEAAVEPLEKFPAYIVDVEAPETAVVGSTLPIKVFFQVNNSCGEFNRFEADTKDKTTHIQVYPHYREGPCLMALFTREVVYEFKPTEPGTYTFRFTPKYSDQEIVKTIVVGETGD